MATFPILPSGSANASTLQGATWEEPNPIGNVTPDTGDFTTLTGVDITGSSSITSSGTFTSADVLLSADGTAITPIIRWSSDTDTGLYRSADNVLGIAAGSVSTLLIKSSGLENLDGSVASPSYTFQSDNTTGLSLSATTVNLSISGIAEAVFTPSLTTFNGDLTTTGILTAGIGAVTLTDSNGNILSAALNTVQIADGGTGATTAQAAIDNIAGLTTKGDILANNGTNNVRLPVGSDGQFLKANSATATGLEWVTSSATFGSGSVGSPSITFTTDGDTGFYNPADGEIGVVSNGLEVTTFKNTGTFFLNGSVANPSIAFINSPQTGLFRAGSNVLGFSVFGVEKARIDSNQFRITSSSTSIGFDVDQASTGDVANFSFGGVDKLKVDSEGIKVEEGNSSNPGLGFIAAPTTGIFRVSGSILGITSASEEVARFSQSQALITINSTSPALQVKQIGSGAIAVFEDSGGADSLLIDDFGLKAEVGDVSNPSYSFAGDTDTGVYRVTSNTLGITAGGSQAASFTSSICNFFGNSSSAEAINVKQTGTSSIVARFRNASNSVIFAVDTQAIRLLAGTAGNPSLTFDVDTDTGFYRIASNTFGVSASGSEIVRFGTTGTTFTVSSTSPAFTSRQNGTGDIARYLDNAGQQVFTVTTEQAKYKDGTVSSPSISFLNDPDTGIYRISSNTLGVSVAAQEKIRVDTVSTSISNDSTTGNTLIVKNNNASAINILSVRDSLNTEVFKVKNNTISILSGTETVPSLSFTLDPDTGIFWPSANTFSITTAGTERFTIDTVKISPFLPIRVNDGTAAVPSYSFENNTDMGFYRIGTDIFGGSVNGVEKFRIGNSSFQINGLLKTGTTPVTLTDAAGKILSAALNTVQIADGGTGATTAQSAIDNIAGLSAKGDLLVRNSTNDVALNVGTDGQILVADSANSNGVDWKAIADDDDIEVAIVSSTPTVRRQTQSGTEVFVVFPTQFYFNTITETLSVADQVRAYKVYLPAKTTFNSIVFEAVNAQAGSLSSVGIYDSAGTTLLIDTGPIGTGTSGIKSTNLGSPVTLSLGWYWVAYTSTVNNLQFRSLTIDDDVIAILNDGTTHFGIASNTSTSGQLPSSLGIVSSSNIPNPPIVKLQG